MIKHLEFDVELRTIRFTSAQFNSKVVFYGLRESLRLSGYEVTSLATSHGGRGGEVAVRLSLSPLRELSRRLRIPVEIYSNSEKGKRFNRYIAFPNLEDVLADDGIEITQREKTLDGVKSMTVVRAKMFGV